MFYRINRVRLSGSLSALFLVASCIPALSLGLPQVCFCQEAEVTAKPFSDEVVAKADKVLGEAGMKRSGKTILVTEAATMNRTISNLAKPRRELKQLQDAWKQTSNQLHGNRQQFDSLNSQELAINVQLAQPGLDVNTHNRLVATHNANVALMRQLETEKERIETKLAQDRKAVIDAETAYAQSVLALRSDFDSLKTTIEEKLKLDNVKIAVKVFATNFATPTTLETATLLGSLERRLKQLEQEVFSENIPLEVTDNGSLYVNVLIGGKNLRMVLDSGASVLSLSKAVADELGITIPADAPRLQLVMADGRSIPGRAVELPSVRIGPFEATSVRAAILDLAGIDAEPLLGMSYLSNFKFEIDTASKTLKLLRVETE